MNRKILNNWAFRPSSMYSANIARKITGDVHVVSDSLDHSSISVTEGYFGAAEPEENDDLVFKVFGE